MGLLRWLYGLQWLSHFHAFVSLEQGPGVGHAFGAKFQTGSVSGRSSCEIQTSWLVWAPILDRTSSLLGDGQILSLLSLKRSE